jgi:integrase
MNIELKDVPLVSNDVIYGTHSNILSDHTATPLPLRDDSVTISFLIDRYMLSYDGKDQSRGQRMRWWQSKIGHITLKQIEDDDIYSAVEELSNQKAKYFHGFDTDGKTIFKAKKKLLQPSTINRYVAAISALFTWAIKKRIAPKTFIHPCRGIERKKENNERVRYLNKTELVNLMESVKHSKWGKLYLLVLLGITTGARRGELERLKWSDIDFEKNVAYTGITKNGDRKTTPLLPKVVDELLKHQGPINQYIFYSERVPTQPFCFEHRWREALKESKVKDFHFHDLRHSCASYLVQSHATLVEVADILGHRDLRTTRRYAHLGTEHKAQVVNRILGHIQ